MPITLHRIDDRLIHGQVVVGWGQPLCVRFIVLVDDDVASSEWEQELYRMGVPPDVDVFFLSVANAVEQYARFASDVRPGILLTGDVPSMLQLVDRVGHIKTVNVGGIHHRADRTQKLRYVFLTPAEEQELRAIEAHNVDVTAQDIPSTRPISLNDVIRGEK
jgi:PTS system mannose-specific IIB component/fructoselysine and glucoselysine-specific PTS system IIB component